MLSPALAGGEFLTQSFFSLQTLPISQPPIEGDLASPARPSAPEGLTRKREGCFRSMRDWMDF